MAIKVSLVEDSEQLRGTLARVVGRADGFECVSQYGSAEDALETLPNDKPNVVLMDINLPGMNGVECVRKLKQALPETQVIMLTAYEDTENIFNSLAAGASGYLLKRSSSAEILQAIKDVLKGGSPMTAHIARKVVQSLQHPSPAARPDDVLSKRESEVLGYVARGYSDKEVAEALGLTTATIRSYLKTIYSKLHVHSRTQAISKAGK